MEKDLEVEILDIVEDVAEIATKNADPKDKEDDKDSKPKDKDEDKEPKKDSEEDETEDKDSKKDKKEEIKESIIEKLKESYKVSEEDIATSVGAIFEGTEDLSEDFKKKVSVVVEAAVNTKILEAIDQVGDTIAEAVESGIVETEATMKEAVEEFLNHSAETWMEENKLAITSGMYQEVAEELISDLRAVFEKHNIEVPESRDLLEESEKKVADLEAEVNQLHESSMELKKEILDMKKTDVLRNLSEGLTDTQVEKFKKLTEEIEAKTLETFQEKAEIVRESFFKAAPVKEETKTDVVKSEISESMQRYIAAAKKSRE